MANHLDDLDVSRKLRRFLGSLVCLCVWIVLPSTSFAEPLDVDQEVLSAPDAEVDADLGSDWVEMSPTEKIRAQDLGADEKQKLAHQRRLVEKIAERDLGEELSRTTADLTTVQRILDQHLLGPNKEETLQALGVVIGDVLVAQKGYRWIAYTDRNERRPVLRKPGSSQLIFPITMVSRREDAGIHVDVAKLYAKLTRRAKGSDLDATP